MIQQVPGYIKVIYISSCEALYQTNIKPILRMIQQIFVCLFSVSSVCLHQLEIFPPKLLRVIGPFSFIQTNFLLPIGPYRLSRY